MIYFCLDQVVKGMAGLLRSVTALSLEKGKCQIGEFFLARHCKYAHLVFYQSNDEVRTPSQFHFKVFPINVRNPMEKKFLKSNQPFLSYLPSSTGHLAKVGRMAGAAQQVIQKGLIGFQKFLFYGVPTINQDNFEVKLGWCSDLIICLIKYQVCIRQATFINFRITLQGCLKIIFFPKKLQIFAK